MEEAEPYQVDVDEEAFPWEEVEIKVGKTIVDADEVIPGGRSRKQQKSP